ncbi:hypothetical protein Bca52824_010847 [Brassica carinata]|uniref:Uncharacterized protein n=1 Tax=Brassica carinata TaxID=52824 RepID=A0A8X8B803_BRACI|nr:hypothetical protein Bca52824_010847 [Brassica carinata]
MQGVFKILEWAGTINALNISGPSGMNHGWPQLEGFISVNPTSWRCGNVLIAPIKDGTIREIGKQIIDPVETEKLVMEVVSKPV